MAEEPKTALAALFQMRGRDAISETEFVLEASHRLRWFTPKEAQKLLQIGVDHGLLRADAGNVRAAFDIGAVSVPVNYRPGAEALIAPPKPVDLFTRILTRIQGSTGEERPPIVARVNEIQGRLGVDADVAAALSACSLGVDVSDLLDDVESAVLGRTR